ncbi:MAG: NrtA/SsuA/CpmA family ABC transporter substrate-binding protein [Candidatus Aminicenantes bacterium]|nr:NrtA/SsuA/CpmA family ABC transporter substrate-binding protein [Candidatus Aminicenantes bacterium]
MKSQTMKLLVFSVIVSVSIVGLLGCQKTEESKKGFTSVQIGWQIPLATQGQIVQVLKQTDILETHGLEANFIPFSYGGPQSEAALAGELDVIFVGDQPVINLIARGGKWKIVSRLFYTKTAIMVPMNSSIRKIEDLRGKTVASPFGSVSHREAILKEQSAGLNADKDVNNINMDILEISNVVQSGGDKSWGKIDAVGVWEPSTSLFEANKLARVVDYTRTLGVVAISDDFMAKHPGETVKFLRAILEAWAYFAAHTDQVNQWYIKDAKLSYTPEILKMAASVEPNYNAKSIKDIDLDLNDEHIKTLEKGAEWSFERGFSKTIAQMRPAVDTSFLAKALE